MATWQSQGASACSTLPGVSGQYHQPVSAKAQTRNPKCPSVASAFGIRPSFGFRPSEFGFGRLAAGGTVQIRPWWGLTELWVCQPSLTAYTRVMQLSLLMALALLGCTQTGLVAAEKALVTAGKFTEVLDPKAGEKEPWCINDHTFGRGPDGTWHVFAITHILPVNFARDPRYEEHTSELQ